MRVQAARSLLAETNLKVHEISYEVGYENVNHFIAHFRKLTGLTPKEYLVPAASHRADYRFPLDNPFIFLYHIEERRRTAQSLI